jgi:hypothetical protein
LARSSSSSGVHGPLFSPTLIQHGVVVVDLPAADPDPPPAFADGDDDDDGFLMSFALSLKPLNFGQNVGLVCLLWVSVCVRG